MLHKREKKAFDGDLKSSSDEKQGSYYDILISILVIRNTLIKCRAGVAWIKSLKPSIPRSQD